jgi:beta-lactamase class A
LFLAGFGGLALAGAGKPSGLGPALAALEARNGGTLGFALLESGTGRIDGYRLDRMFGLCSTFKLLLAGLVLQAAARGELSLDQQVKIGAADVVQWSPVTKPMIGKSLSVRALAEGTQTTSDNGAANLLMALLGGPHGVTKRLRAMGDKVSRIDRWEPEMNRVVWPDERDSSTPRAMAQTVAKMVLDDVLGAGDKAMLAQWMVDTRTGLDRLRAGAPAGWRVGDKTGTGLTEGMPNRTNDIAVLWPPGGAPLVAVGFYEASGYFAETRAEDEALLADAMRAALAIRRA